MKRLFAWSTLAASFLLPFPFLAQAGAEGSSVERLYTAEGIVSAFDADQVTLDTDEGPLDFNLDDSVRIYREGRRVPRNAIQSGDRARATYQESQDGNLDDEVLVRLDLEPGTAE